MNNTIDVGYGWMQVAQDDCKEGDEHSNGGVHWNICSGNCDLRYRRRRIQAPEGYRILSKKEAVPKEALYYDRRYNSWQDWNYTKKTSTSYDSIYVKAIAIPISQDDLKKGGEPCGYHEVTRPQPTPVWHRISKDCLPSLDKLFEVCHTKCGSRKILITTRQEDILSWEYWRYIEQPPLPEVVDEDALSFEQKFWQTKEAEPIPSECKQYCIKSWNAALEYERKKGM